MGARRRPGDGLPLRGRAAAAGPRGMRPDARVRDGPRGPSCVVADRAAEVVARSLSAGADGVVHGVAASLQSRARPARASAARPQRARCVARPLPGSRRACRAAAMGVAGTTAHKAIRSHGRPVSGAQESETQASAHLDRGEPSLFV